jgi:molecular chaperone GrpE
VEILQPGYRIGDRVVRPARVAVAEPDPNATAAEAAPEAAPEAAAEAADEPSADEHR